VIIVGLLVIALPSLILFSRGGKSRDAARRELEKRSMPFTEREFANHIRHRDLEVIKLYLAAGINPDARDEEGATVLMQAVQAGDESLKLCSEMAPT
jgi:ankyrin repeat protein